ncbi:MAG TPA: hypothetical protein DC047_13185 [Blastocatellia bacterium]|nr:hypothetical protein [Blastocatellia bacterium]
MFPTLAGIPTHVPLRWSEESLLAVARSINISLRWSEEATHPLLYFKSEFANDKWQMVNLIFAF